MDGIISKNTDSGFLDTLSKPSNTSGSLVNQRSVRLSQLKFNDLFISETGKCFIRGLAIKNSASLVNLETINLNVSDIQTLRNMVMQQGQYEKEFFIFFDDVPYRVSQINDVNGLWYTLRRHKKNIPFIKEIGFAPPIIRQFGKIAQRRGLIILAGRTGDGKTTTAYSLLQSFLRNFGDIGVTIENPLEMLLSGEVGNSGYCYQLKLENGQTFGEAFEYSMRYTPRYIFIGEIRRPDEALQAVRAAISGHVVITTIHAGSVQQAINSLINLTTRGDVSLAFAREQLAEGLAGVVWQRLEDVYDSEGRPDKRLHYSTLFFGDDEGLRNKVRAGETNQLGSDIERQARLIEQGKEPSKYKDK